MSSNRRGVRIVPLISGAMLALPLALPLVAHALTVNEISETSRRVKGLEALTAEAKAKSELDKYGGVGGAGVPATRGGLTSERTLDDGVALLSVTGPSADPTYVVQFRGVPLALKVGRDAMDGWVLDAIKGNYLLLARKDGKGRVTETKKVQMTDLSYASQREQQRLDAARLQAGSAGGAMPGVPMFPMPPGQAPGADKTPTP